MVEDSPHLQHSGFLLVPDGVVIVAAVWFVFRPGAVDVCRAGGVFLGGQRLVGARGGGAALTMEVLSLRPHPGVHKASVLGTSWQDKARLSCGFAAISCPPQAHKWAF